MGNVCCGSKEEAAKPSAIDETDEPTDIGLASSVVSKDYGSNATQSLDTPEQLHVVKQEQARLEWIVQATGRRMVAVRSTRSPQGYYVDQGFAAALYQHLEQTTAFPAHPSHALPTHSAVGGPDGVYKDLAAPAWDSIQLGSQGGGGLAGCGSKHPHDYLDHMAETFLDGAVPKNPFAGAAPMVENLL